MGNNKYELSIIIINYRTPDLITDCLETLLPEVKDLNAKVVIVDNHSGDDSPLLINKWLDENDNDNKVVLICSEINSGFSGGNNTGLKSIDSEFYLLLNSDTLIREGAIKILLNTIKQFPNAGIVSPRLEWQDGTAQVSCFKFMTPYSELISSANTGVITRLLGNYNVPIPVSDDISYPEWTSFACVMVRDRVFKEIGIMDDEYFMYFEDTEFCYRTRKNGWEILNNPEAKVVHLRGGSSPVKENSKQRKRLPKYFYESRTRYFFKTYGWSGLVLANLFWWLGRTISKLREIFGRKIRSACDQQWLDIWTNWINPQRKYTRP